MSKAANFKPPGFWKEERATLEATFTRQLLASKYPLKPKPIRVYIHVAGMNHWESILEEFVTSIEGSGLNEYAFVTVSAAGEIPIDMHEKLSIPDDWRILYQTEGKEAFEYPTLRTLWSECRKDPSGHVLYLHTKGAGRPSRHREAWRHYMTHLVVHQWRECYATMIHARPSIREDGKPRRLSCLGNDWHWNPEAGCGHFCGNFWWANAEYISKLRDPNLMKPVDQKGPRYGAEIWIGSGNKDKVPMDPCEIFRCNNQFYLHRPNPIPPDAYIGHPLTPTYISISEK